MNKVANYKDIIYKKAGTLGGAMAGVYGGAALGAGAGTLAVKARNTFTLDKERKQLSKDLKQSKKDLGRTSTEYGEYTQNIDNEVQKEFNNYMASLSPRERREVTVGELESRLKAKSLSIQKHASTKSTLKAALITGAPVAGITGMGVYNMNANKKTMKSRIDKNNASISNYKDVLSGKKKYNPDSYIVNMIHDDMDSEEAKWVMDDLNKELSRKGIDIKNVKYKEYKRMVKDYNDSQANSQPNTNHSQYAVSKYLKKIATQETGHEITKEASARKGDVIPADYSRVKQIELDPSEFRTVDLRNMRFHEKVKENAGKAAQNAKTIAKNIKGAPKWKKALLAGMAGAGTVATLATANEARHLLKNPDKQRDTLADKSRDKDLKTKVFRDMVRPDMKREMNIAPSRMALSLALIKPTMKASRYSGEMGAKLGKKIAGGKNGGAIAGKIIGDVAAAYAVNSPILLHDALLKSHQEAKELGRLKKRYLGENITPEEKKEIFKNNLKDKFNIKKSNYYEYDKPEEKIQKLRREAKKNGKQYNKVASDILEDMCKEAKWSKEDKKGYAKNVAIGVAQDFLNAGNPLNIGSSIVGSIADSALLERSSLNLNKQLKADEAKKNKVKNFNTAMNVKNGTALPKKIMGE